MNYSCLIAETTIIIMIVHHARTNKGMKTNLMFILTDTCISLLTLHVCTCTWTVQSM